MRLEGCVRRDDKMDIRGTSCILYVNKHRDNSPTDDECGHAQYNYECDCAQYDDQGVHKVHDTMSLRSPPFITTD